MARVLLFDVNETLLDLKALDPHFEQIFGAPAVREQWFVQLLRQAMVATITGIYHDFSALAADALDIVALRNRIALAADGRQQLLSAIRSLPPHPEVPESLEMLQHAGFRLATLTNSPSPTLEAQMQHAGLHPYFERLLSVDAVRQFKPARATYEYAAKELGVAVRDIRLVAAHDWDIAGAMHAGCAAAFVARPGQVLGSLQAKPDIIGADLQAVARQIVALSSN
ncbi:MAG: haloacid dehalogenase type II [Caldilinea sp. CFX5]|nr:haloacid dehalogenase type II [Caldilinea sp. CFX5]